MTKWEERQGPAFIKVTNCQTSSVVLSKCGNLMQYILNILNTEKALESLGMHTFQYSSMFL